MLLDLLITFLHTFFGFGEYLGNYFLYFIFTLALSFGKHFLSRVFTCNNYPILTAIYCSLNGAAFSCFWRTAKTSDYKTILL